MNFMTRLVLACGVAFALAATLAAAPAARAANGPHAAKMKAVQLRVHKESMRARFERYRALRRGKPGVRARLPRETFEPGGRPAAPQAGEAAARIARPLGAMAPPANVRANDPAGDAAGAGQAEQSIAVHGNNVLVAWNDGQGFVTGPDIQGYGYSTDGGATFTDGGAPPKGANWTWTSDPLVAVNETTGEFYFCALVDSSTGFNGIGIVKATFSGSNIVWGTPRLVAIGSNSTVGYDKPWLAVDAVSGNVFVTYTLFTLSGDQIEIRRSLDGATTWSGASPISNTSAPPTGENGLVQGSRVVAHNGTVYAMYYVIGPIAADFYKVRKSTNHGATWGAAQTGASAFTNWAAGAPGFNRGVGITFAGMAMDRTGANPGRLYLTWAESVNYYNDNLGTGTSKSEVENNNDPSVATPYTPGQVLRGALGNSSDLDWFSFDGTQGQTLVAFVDSVNTSVDGFLRLFCTDGNQRLSLSAPGAGGNTGGLVVFTLPTTGTYYLRFASGNGAAGGYRIVTGLHAPQVNDRARDHRDVYVTWSDNGIAWSNPVVRVNDDPGWFDNWLPEIAVDPAGRAYTLWYDWRDAAAIKCGGVSHTYLAYSVDGGPTWTSAGAVSDAQTDWTLVNSNIAPNQGDYLGLYADATNIYPAWADGRTAGTAPDVYVVTLPIATTPVTVSLVSATAEPGHVRVSWAVSSEVTSAVAYRRADGGEWTALGTVVPDGGGRITVDDTAVASGTRYGYRLGVRTAGGAELLLGETWVAVPTTLALALDPVRPNPTQGDLWISFTLPASGAARLEILDVAGRRVRAREVGSLGAGRHTLDLAEGERLSPGVYVVRLSREERVLTTRVSVVR